MVSTQQIFRFIDAGSKVRRPPLVGVSFLHERRVAAGIARSSPKAGLIRFIARKFAASRQDTRIRPTCTAGGPSHDCANDQAAMSKREAFQFHGKSSAMRLAG
jgi:hypothetical protein